LHPEGHLERRCGCFSSSGALLVIHSDLCRSQKGDNTEMKLGLAIAAAGMMAVSAFAALESGLKPGTPATPFQVVDVTGPHKGEQLCYR